jgi:hypothetical protein
MTTALPSVAFWPGALPVTMDYYDFRVRGGMEYFLNNPDRYDKLLIAVGNFFLDPERTEGPFMLDCLARYHGRWNTIFSLNDVIEQRAAQGKKPEDTIIYMPGWHGENMATWTAAARAGRLDDLMHRTLEMFRATPSFKCSFAFDGSSDAYSWNDIVPRCFAHAMGRGAPCLTEGAPSPRSVLAECPSVTTAASAATRTMPSGSQHGILLTNSWFVGNPAASDKDRPSRTDIKQNLVPRWRAEDRPVFLQAGSFNQRTHELPAFWHANTAEPIGQGAGAEPVVPAATT